MFCLSLLIILNGCGNKELKQDEGKLVITVEPSYIYEQYDFETVVVTTKPTTTATTTVTTTTKKENTTKKVTTKKVTPTPAPKTTKKTSPPPTTKKTTKKVTTTQKKTYRKGDINGDGRITMADYKQLQDYMARKYSPQWLIERGDMDNDGKITTTDLRILYMQIEN